MPFIFFSITVITIIIWNEMNRRMLKQWPSLLLWRIRYVPLAGDSAHFRTIVDGCSTILTFTIDSLWFLTIFWRVLGGSLRFWPNPSIFFFFLKDFVSRFRTILKRFFDILRNCWGIFYLLFFFFGSLAVLGRSSTWNRTWPDSLNSNLIEFVNCFCLVLLFY